MHHVALVVMLIVGVPEARSGTTVSWSEMEPLFKARFGIQSEGEGRYSMTTDAPMPESSVPDAAREAVLALTSREDEKGRALLQRLAMDLAAAMKQAGKEHGLGDLAADSERYRTALFANPRAVRMLHEALSDALTERGITCADCAPPPTPPRPVSFADFVPYLSRFIFVGKNDLTPEGKLGFHICSGVNGLGDVEQVDTELAAVALAVMFRSQPTGARDHAGSVLKRVRGVHPGPESQELRDVINAEVAGRLAQDAEYLDPLRPLIVEEAEKAGLVCRDCSATTAH